MKYTTILVDIDDTIWDTRNNSREAFQEIYRDQQWNNYFESFDQFYNLYLPINIQLWSLYAQGKVKKEELIVKRFMGPLSPYFKIDEKAALALNDELLKRIGEKQGTVEDAYDLLDYLEQRYKLIVLSNGFREIQYKKLKNSSLDKYFQHVILSDEVGANKPSRKIFDFALKTAGATSHQVMMLGDSWESDIQGAYQSGIDQIWFNPDQIAEGEFSPTHTVQKLKEVMDIL